MEKLTVVVPREHTDALLRRLMRLRAVSLTDATAAQARDAISHVDSDESAAAERAARVDAVLPVLQKRSQRKFSLFPAPHRCSYAEFRASEKYTLAWKIVNEAEKLLARQKELAAEREGLLSQMQGYAPYLDCEQPLDFTGTAHAGYMLGVLPAGISEETVLDALEGRATVVQVLCEDKTGRYVSVIYHRDEAEQTMRALSAIGFLAASFPDAGGTAKALFDRADRRRVKAEEDAERTERRLCALAERLDEIEMLRDVEHTALLAERQKKELAATRNCAVLTGWCPAHERARVIRVLESVEAAYDFAAPAEGEDPPVLLKNNSFARNFEWVVGMYSYPAYGKFDPTFVMSIFYMIIFGLMFADAGYGLVLSAACFALVRFTHPREGMKRFLLMFGYCGLSCIVCGILFGSYFGNFPLAFLENFVGRAPEQLPNLSILPSEAANVAVIFDPLQNPMGFLIVSLGIGAVHLLAGMAVQAYILCRKGRVLDALFDIGSYWLLFAGIGTLALGLPAGLWLTLGGVLAILLTQGRAKKGVAGKLIGGFGGLYGLINYVSDLLSYSRILALGLAAGVIGQVVNILATLKGASFIGFILMVVVFCIGHLLNLVINVLGTFVHTSRLQYIEFFGKFYEDGGTPFRPIKVAERYSEDTTPAEPETVIQK